MQQFYAAEGIPGCVAEYRFHNERRWRFDYAWPAIMLAMEVEGGVWTRGRHTRSGGFLADMEKYNSAAALGWRIIRCVPGDEMSHGTVAYLTQAKEHYHATDRCEED
jgi:hypothetical protein